MRRRLLLIASMVLSVLGVWADDVSVVCGETSVFPFDTRGTDVARLNDSPTVHYGGELTESDAWPAGRVHVVYGTLIVPTDVTLTIESGAVVKFVGGGIIANGSCIADGAILTDIDDDAVGGDTRGNGMTPARTSYVMKGNVIGEGSAQVRCLDVQGNYVQEFVSAKVLFDTRGTDVARLNDSPTVHYGGELTESDTWAAGGTHVVFGTVVVPTNVTLTIASGAVVKFVGGGIIANGSCIADGAIFTDIDDDAVGGDTCGNGTTPARTSYVLKGNVVGGGSAQLRCLDVQGNYVQEFVSAKVLFDTRGICDTGLGDAVVHEGGTLCADETWAVGSVHVVYGSLFVPEGVTLTIEPGTVVKFVGGNLIVDGNCVARGVTFTDLDDDSSGGDTRGNGVSSPFAVFVLSGNFEMDDATRILCLSSACASFRSNCASDVFYLNTETNSMRFAHQNEPITFSTEWDGSSFVRVTVTGPDGVMSVLTNGTSECKGVLTWSPSLGGSYVFRHETDEQTLEVSLYAIDGAIVHEGVLKGTNVWSADALHVVNGSVSVSTDSLLTIEPGAVVKFADDSSLTIVGGGVCVAEGVVFTSIYDDAVGGDTLCDGDATVPVANGYAIVGFVQDDFATEYRYGVQSYSGALAGNVEWRKEKTYIIDGTLTVATNGVLTIPAGTVVKFTEGSAIKVSDGGVCVAEGAIFTHIADDSVGGDTMGDGDETKPEYGKYTVDVAVLDSDATEYRYSAPVLVSGTISGNVVWRARQVYHVTANLTLASGATLSIAPGSVVKFNPNVSLTVNSGATLNAQGTRSTPVVFTSIKDDAHGGDTNGDGGATVPNPGDWKKIAVSGTANLNYCLLLYGAAGTGTDDAVLINGGTAVFSNSMIAHGQMYAVGLESGHFYMTNSIITDVFCVFRHWPSDPVVNSVIYNCTRLSNNDGQKFVNCIIQGISKEWDWSGGSGNIYSNCLIYNPKETDNQNPPGNFIGSDGNMWGVDPLLVDPDNGDFRISAESPCVDAGDVVVASVKDYYGQPRQGAAPEIGICEIMPRDMVADVDLATVSVSAPECAVAGDKMAIVWAVRNFGTEDAVGERYDKVEFVSDMGVVVAEQILRRRDRIAAGGEAVIADSVRAPSIEGSFSVRVIVNCYRDIVEGASYANNAGLSDARVTVGISTEQYQNGASGWLAAGSSAVHRFAVDGAGLLKVTAQPGTVVTIRDAGSLVGRTATIGADGFVWLSIGSVPTVDVVAQGGTISGSYEMSFFADSMLVTGTAPDRVSCEGVSVVRVDGVGLDGSVAVWIRQNGVERLPLGTKVADGVLFVTVDGSALEAGAACDIVLHRADERKEIVSAFSVDRIAGVGRPYVKLNVPTEARYGKLYECTLEYGNDGTADVPAPIFQITADSDVKFFYVGDPAEYECLQFVGAGEHGNVSVIGPGEMRKIKFAAVYRENGSVSVKSSWNNDMYPEVWASESAYLSDMHAAADRIDMRGGDATDFRSVRELAERLHAGESVDVIYGWWSHSDGTPVVGAALVFTNGESSVTVTTDEEGRYETDALQPGPWHLESKPGTNVVLASGRDSRFDMRETGKFSAIVSVVSDAADVSVTATEDETMDSYRALPYGENDWVFYSLPTGFYSVAVRAGSNRVAALTLFVEDGETPVPLYVSPEVTGTISGHVSGRSDADAEAPVWIVGVAQGWLVMPDVNGRWSVNNVPAGYYSVELLTTNAAAYTQYEAIELKPGGALTCDIESLVGMGKQSAMLSSMPRSSANRLASVKLLSAPSEPTSNDFDAWLAYADSLLAIYWVNSPAGVYNCQHNRSKMNRDQRCREQFAAYLAEMSQFQLEANDALLWVEYLKGVAIVGQAASTALGVLATKINLAKSICEDPLVWETLANVGGGLMDIADWVRPDRDKLQSQMSDIQQLLADMETAVRAGLSTINIAQLVNNARKLAGNADAIKGLLNKISEKVPKGINVGKIAQCADVANTILSAVFVLKDAIEQGEEIKKARERYMEAKAKLDVEQLKFQVRSFISKASGFNNYPLCCYSEPDPPYNNANPVVDVKLYQPLDPNEIRGPAGIGAARYVRNGDWMDYTICFENKSTANAAAWDVYITLPKDAGLDWGTFESAGVSCGDWLDIGLSGKWEGSSVYVVPGTNYSVRTEIAQATDAVNWHLRIVDPTTLDNYPEDPAGGFLPPNDETGRGEGYVRFRVKVRDNVTVGSIINASASIVFDYNDPIETDPAWSNTVAQVASVKVNGEVEGEAADLDLIVGLPYGELPTPLPRVGHTFDGWYTGPNGTGRRVTAQSLVQDGDSGLYAHWIANVYTMRFDANGGVVSPGSKQMEYGAAIGELPTPTRDGYTFAGWQMDGEIVAADTIYVMAWDSVALAQWTRNPDPIPTPEPTLEPAPRSEESHELYVDVAGAAPAVAASEYNGYLYDAGGVVKGTIQVKVGKPGKDGKASVKATAQVGASKATLKAADNGKAALAKDGPTTIQLVGGEACTVVLGAEGLSGSYGAYTIDGARNFFSSKDKSEQGAANDLLAKWLGPVNVVWDGGSASVSIAKKGKAKVSVTLANGTKATANSQVLVGEKMLCVPVVVTKKANLAFALWLPLGGGQVIVEGLGDGAIAGKAGTLGAGAKFRLDAVEFAAVFGQAVLPYLPDGIAVTQSGTKWTLPKAGKIAYKDGAVDETKLGDNPSGLKLTYKAKDGSFKGSFKVYAVDGGKAKATTVNVAGVMVNGVGYGTATIKGKDGVSVTVK